MRRRTVLAAAASSLGAAAGCAVQQRAAGTETGPSVAWHHETDGEPTVAVGPDRAYVTDGRGVAAVDRATGSVDWERSLSGVRESRYDGSRGVVYAWGDVGLVALDADGGGTRWRVDGAYQSAYLSGDTLTAYGADGDETIRVDPDDGGVVWTWRGNLLDELTGRWAVSYGRELTGVDLRDGTVAWTFDAGVTQNLVGLHRSSGTLLAAARNETGSDRLVGLAVDDGAVRWERALPRGIHGGGVFRGRAYVSSTDTGTERSHVDAIEPASGRRRWRRDVGTRAPHAVPAAEHGGDVVFTQWSWSGPIGNTLALASEDGAVSWSRRDHGFVTASDGRVVVQAAAGTFEGIAPGGETAWEARMDLVVDGQGGYEPPDVGTRRGSVVAGFRGTTRVASRSVRTGALDWEVTTEDAFRELVVRGPDVLALGEGWVSDVRV